MIGSLAGRFSSGEFVIDSISFSLARVPSYVRPSSVRRPSWSTVPDDTRMEGRSSLAGDQLLVHRWNVPATRRSWFEEAHGRAVSRNEAIDPACHFVGAIILELVIKRDTGVTMEDRADIPRSLVLVHNSCSSPATRDLWSSSLSFPIRNRLFSAIARPQTHGLSYLGPPTVL
jgi:hypothetical protein